MHTCSSVGAAKVYQYAYNDYVSYKYANLSSKMIAAKVDTVRLKDLLENKNNLEKQII